MHLVFEDKNKPGRMEVSWTWLPFFIASNTDLIKRVDKVLVERFSGQEITNTLLTVMHQAVIDIILNEYKIRGLEGYLTAISGVEE